MDDSTYSDVDENGVPYGLHNPRPLPSRYSPLPWDDEWLPARPSAAAVRARDQRLGHRVQPSRPEPAHGSPGGPAEPWSPPRRENLDIDLALDLPWAIGPCIGPGDCAYFVGLDGEGKTTLVADILWGMLAGPAHDDAKGQGRCLAGAWPINRDYYPHGGLALVLNGETSGKIAWARKLMNVGFSRGVLPLSAEDREIRSRVDLLDGPDVNLRPNLRHEDSVAFAHWVISVGYRLVIIDPVFNFFDPDDQADPTWATRSLRPFVTTLKEANINVLCIAHPSQTALDRGRRGGPSLDKVYTPFGTMQQRAVIDARFGVGRVDSNQQQVELLNFKSRRDTDNWIPRKGQARIRLTFSEVGAGYSQHQLVRSGWELYDPTGGVVLGEATRKLLCKLPAGPFGKEHLDDVEVTKKVWAKHRDDFLLPQGLLHMETLPEKGAPLLYHLTDRGLRARAQAIEAFPYEVPDEDATS